VLRRHLRVAHDLEVADYRTRWRLPPQFLLIGSFSLNYLLDPKSETPPPIGQVRLESRTEEPR